MVSVQIIIDTENDTIVWHITKSMNMTTVSRNSIVVATSAVESVFNAAIKAIHDELSKAIRQMLVNDK